MADSDTSSLPDYEREFIRDADLAAFASALAAPELTFSTDDGTASSAALRPPEFITAFNDWGPVHHRVRGRGKKRRTPRRGKDETREGFVYTLLKWPLLGVVMAWIVVLGALYLLTRLYIFLYEQFVTWRGKRERLRRKLRAADTYEQWKEAAAELDVFLGNE